MLSSGQQQSSASFPPPLTRLIWFLLVDSETGEPYKGATAASVSLSPGAVIDQRNNAEDKGKEQPLDPTESIGVLGSKEDMLVIAVPDLSLIKEPSRESKRAKQSAFRFLLVDSETGEPYKGFGIDAVSLSPDADIIQFRDAVHAKNSPILPGIVPVQLVVYKNKAAFDRRNNAEDKGKEQPLKASRILDGLGESEEEALIVAAPSPRDDILVSNKKTKKTTSYRFLLLDSASGQPFKGTTADFVSLPSGADVAEFRKLVHLQNSNNLTGIDVSSLLVFKNKAAFDRRNNAEDDGKEQPLDPNESVGMLGSKEDMLVVAVPDLIRDVTESKGRISFGRERIPSTSLNSLYIRKCYKTIASSILKVNGIHKAIISGTPGIGKSLFLIYLLWRLVKEGKRVLFMYDSFNIYYDGNGGVFRCASTRLPLDDDDSFWNDTLWCLFDAKFKTEPDLIRLPVSLSTFIVSTSPRREMVNDFRKPPEPEVFYMPTWTEAELNAIVPLFHEVSKWRERFRILGGIPRHVLEVTKKDPTVILEAACEDCELDDCIKKIGLNSTITEKSKAVHSLVHITSDPPYTESSVRYASAEAIDIIVRQKGEDARSQMRQLLASCEGNPLTAALCGYIFESYAIESLERGGKFTCRELVGGNTKVQPKETTLKIPKSKKKVVDKVLRNQTSGQLYVPITRNYTAIDGWMPGIGAFQMTVGKRHSINRRVKVDLAKLGKGNKLYWVLPPAYYDSFTKQSPHDIEQHAIKINYPK
eukprot:CCRYP_015337-RB/>CCRYP_015337-RB protein AED:0.28 eAED:0.75 QI:201/0/0/1/0/0/3/0/756